MAKIEYLFMEPIKVCNFQCIMCDARYIGHMTKIEKQSCTTNMNLYERIINELNKTHSIKYVEFQGLGEPLLAGKVLFEMISYNKKNKIFTEVTSNGILLNPKNSEKLVESGLNALIVSVDSANDKIMQEKRKNSKPSIIRKNISKFVATYGTDVYTSINSVLHDYSKNSLLNMVKYCVDYGINVIHFLHLIDGKNEQSFKNGIFGGLTKNQVDTNFQAAIELGKENEILVITPETEHRISDCELIQKSITVAYDGRVNPCCRLDSIDMSYVGRIPENSEQILKQHKKFEQTHIQNRFCNICVKYLWNYEQLMKKLEFQLNKGGVADGL